MDKTPDTLLTSETAPAGWRERLERHLRLGGELGDGRHPSDTRGPEGLVCPKCGRVSATREEAMRNG